MDGDDVGVCQATRRLCFLEESRLVFRPFRLGQGFEIDGLDRDGALDKGVAGLVDDAHRAAPQLSGDLVASEMIDHLLNSWLWCSCRWILQRQLVQSYVLCIPVSTIACPCRISKVDANFRW